MTRVSKPLPDTLPDAVGPDARTELVEAARVSIAKGSKSFAAASKLFDQQTRERVWMLYAWCRRCDDTADGQEHGGALSNDGDPQARLAHIRQLSDAALRGEATGDAAFDALGVVAAESAIPRPYIDDLIEGFALDSDGWRPRTEADMLRYCYHVAGVVGKMMALVMGVRPDDAETLEQACALGYAFQLGNIARDIREDAEAGRCYLPQDWLDAGLTHAECARRLAVLAAQYESQARIGARKLPFRSRWAVLAAAGIYGGIAREVVRRGSHAWNERVATTKAQKLGWVARALFQALSCAIDRSICNRCWRRFP